MSLFVCFIAMSTPAAAAAVVTPTAGGGARREDVAAAGPVAVVAASNKPAAAGGVPANDAYESASDDEDPSDLRRSLDPFARSHAHTASAGSIPAPQPKSEFPTRAAAFWDTMQSESGIIDEAIVRRFCFDYGSPEKPAGGRALLWKLLLGYLPWDRRQWAESLKRSRATYAQFVHELTSNPFAGMDDPLGKHGAAASSSSSSSSAASPAASPSSSSSRTNLKMVKLGKMEDPLGAGFSSAAASSSSAVAATTNNNNSWAKYYADNSIREEIEKDVRRTYSTFHFFQERVRPLETTPEEIRQINAAEKAKNAAALAAQQAEDRRQGRGGSTNLFGNSGGSFGSDLFDEHTLRATTAAKDSSLPAVPKVECVSSASKRSEDENHHDVIKRILFVYAKLNPGIRYVQGMNELLAPIYYVFAHNGSELRRPDSEGQLVSGPLDVSAAGLFGVETAESDAFFCFTAIMSHMRDRFIKSLDMSPTGVLNVIANLNKLLQRIDYQLWSHLQEIQVDPRFYSFRWLTLILSQEFELPDVLRLWDSLFAAEPEASMESVDSAAVFAAAAGHGRKASPVPPPTPASDDSSNKKLIVEFLNDCCCAILCMIRRQLLESDFSSALKLLQSAGAGIDVQRVLFKAQEIQKVRRSGGGYVKEAPAKPLPGPLNPKDLATPFTAPVLRPGEQPEKKGHKTLNIALLDAVQPNQAHPPAAATASTTATSTKAGKKQQQPALHPPILSSASGASSSSSSSSSSVSASPPVSSSPTPLDSEVPPSSLGALAAGVGALVMQGVEVAQEVGAQGFHVVEHAVGQAVQSGAALAAVAAEAIAPPPSQPPAKPAKLKPHHKTADTHPPTGDATHALPVTH